MMKNPKNLWRIYVIALSLIALFVTLEFGVAEFALHENKYNVEATNMSGRQRMLSQRIALFAKDYVLSDNVETKENTYQVLMQARDLFEKSHTELIYRDTETKELNVAGYAAYKIYFDAPHNADQQVKKYIKLTDIILSDIPREEKLEPLAEIRMMAKDSLIEALDAVVTAVEAYDHEEFRRIEIIEITFYTLAMLILLLEAIFIFRPAHNFIIKTLEERDILEKQRIKAAQTSKMATLGEMSAGIVHEINNPLTIIYGQMEILKMLLEDKKDEDIEKRFGKIGDATDRISHITDNLKRFSRQTQMENVSSYTVEEILNASIDVAKHALDRENIEINLELDINPHIYCNRIEMEQVFVNLIMNAKDAVKDLEQPWIELKVTDSGLNAKISVIDSGQGIDAAHLENIFETFYTSKEGEGTGLGLSICKSIIDRHGGTLYYDKEAKNTTFSVELKAYSS